MKVKNDQQDAGIELKTLYGVLISDQQLIFYQKKKITNVLPTSFMFSDPWTVPQYLFFFLQCTFSWQKKKKNTYGTGLWYVQSEALSFTLCHCRRVNGINWLYLLGRERERPVQPARNEKCMWLSELQRWCVRFSLGPLPVQANSRSITFPYQFDR